MSTNTLGDSKKQYCQIPLKIIQNFGHSMPFAIFLKLADNKMVKISNQDENVSETVSKYMQKGATGIFAMAQDYNVFIEELNKEITSKFFNPETSPEVRLEALRTGIDLLRASFQRVGPKEECFKLATTLAARMTEMVKGQANIDELYARFKKDCHQEIIKGMFISACVVAMIETFEWQSEQTKEKAVQAVMLRDISLSNEDLIELNQHQGDWSQLKEHIFKHPIITAKLLNPPNNKLFAQDVVTVVEQHHERPDGKGFPGKLDHRSVILLSAIHIVADCYVHEMIKIQFAPERKIEVVEALRDEFKKGTFRKAFDALETVLKR